MRPDIKEKLKGLPQPERWIVIDGQTGECLSDAPGHLQFGYKTLTPIKSTSDAAPHKYIHLTGHYDTGKYADYWYYVVGDIPPDVTISARHSNIFVEGSLGKNSQINVDRGIISVQTLGRNACISSTCTALIGSLKNSQLSLNTTADMLPNGLCKPAILEIKPGSRKRAFAHACTAQSSLMEEFSNSTLTKNLKYLVKNGFATDWTCPATSPLNSSFEEAGFTYNRGIH